MRVTALIVLMVIFSSMASIGFCGDGHEIPLDDFPRFLDGYRIQVGAYSSEAAACSVRDSLQIYLREPVNLRYADQLWRVRVGAFADSAKAVHTINLELVPLGYYGCRVIKDRINADSEAAVSGEMVDGFRVQVQAVADREKALEYGRKMDFNNPDDCAYVIWEDGMYKIQMGDFKLRSDAEKWKDQFNQIDGNSAWIVARKVYVDPVVLPREIPEVDPFDYMD